MRTKDDGRTDTRVCLFWKGLRVTCLGMGLAGILLTYFAFRRNQFRTAQDHQLLVAAANDDALGVYRALQLGANANATDDDTKLSPYELLKQLLFHTRQRATGQSALMILLEAPGRPGLDYQGDPKDVLAAATVFTEAGADLNVRDSDGCTPLMIALGYHYKGVPSLFIRHGANVNTRDKDGNWLITYSDAQNIDKLVQHGADINSRDPSGTTPLMTAVSRGDAELVRKLVMFGADTTLRDSSGASALDHAVQIDSSTSDYVSNNKTRIIRLLTPKHPAR